MMYVLIDENGISLEFVEVERLAKVGDYIAFKRDDLDITANKPYKVESVYSLSKRVLFTDDAYETQTWKSPSDDYIVLEPTDFVHIDGERYRMVDRKAKVGEKVIIVAAKWAFGKYENGSVVVAEDVDELGIYNDDVKDVKRNEFGIIAHREYRVLEPAIQAKRVKEFELEINDWRAEAQKWQKFYEESEESHSETKELLKSIVKQNKRYREYLELIKTIGTYGKDISTGEIIRSDEANLAEEALESEE